MKQFNLVFCFIYILEIVLAVNLKTLIREVEENVGKYNVLSSNMSFCKNPGLICKSCTELVKCIDVGSGAFEEIVIQTCRNEESCFRSQCTADPNPKCGRDYDADAKDLPKLSSKETPNNTFDDSESLSYSYNGQNCKISGLFCKSCTDLIKCIEVESGMFKEILIKKCSKEETCLINKCSTFQNARCLSKETFTCTATGTFPDPYDCQIYHICVKGTDVIVPHPEQSSDAASDYHVAIQCRHGFGYNYGTTFCEDSLDENNGFCPQKPPVPACVTLGQAEKLGNTPYYYVCVESKRGKLVPIMHMCPHGTILNQSGKCE